MPVAFECPACQHHLSTARRKAGSVVVCPVCHEEQRVPQEIVISTKDVVWEQPPTVRVGGLMAGLFAGWASLIVLALAIHSTGPTQTAQALEAPPPERVPPAPMHKPKEPDHAWAKWIQEMGESTLLAQRLPEKQVAELPPAPPVPTPPPAAPAAPMPPVIRPPVVAKELPVPVLPVRTLEEQVVALMSVPEVTTTRQSRKVFFSTNPQQHLTNMLQVHPEFTTMPFLPLSLAKRTGDDALGLHVLSPHLRDLKQQAEVRLPDGSIVLDIQKLHALMMNTSAYAKKRATTQRELLESRTNPKNRQSQKNDMLARQFLAWTLRIQASQLNEWQTPLAVVTLLNVLQSEDARTRLFLVQLLDGTPGPRATQALAMRALFDLDPVVRQAAITALAKRPKQDYRQVFLMGLQYPWTPVNENAADAIVKLRDYQSLDFVEDLLAVNQPRDVVRTGGNSQETFLVREPVRLMHRTNCLMCHAVSMHEKDIARANMPRDANPSIEVLGFGPPTAETPSYYGDAPTTSEPTIFVRSDVSFLRPDHSVNLPLAPGITRRERFDFTVRTRPATPAERELLRKQPDHPSLYPNRPALLYILHQLDKPAYALRLQLLENDLKRNGWLPGKKPDAPDKLAGMDPTAPKGKKPKQAPPAAKPDPEQGKLREKESPNPAESRHSGE